MVWAFLKDESGGTAVEYALIVWFVGCGMIATFLQTKAALIALGKAIPAFTLTLAP